MCDTCQNTPCLPRCPNADDPPAMTRCVNCDDEIKEHEYYYNVLGDTWCKYCMANNEMMRTEI